MLLAEYAGVYAIADSFRTGRTEMQRGLLLSLTLIFGLLAIPLGSYIQPLIIMSAIPFGVVGALCTEAGAAGRAGRISSSFASIPGYYTARPA